MRRLIAAVVLGAGIAGYIAGRRGARAPESEPSASPQDTEPALAAPGPARLGAPRPVLEARPSVGAAPAPRSGPWPERAVARHQAYRSLVASPLDFMLRRTYLGRPDEFAAFVADRGRIEAYLGHPMIRGALDSPAVLRQLLRPAVVQAFLRAPAMQDSRAVRALAASPLLGELPRHRGVRALLDDPALIRGVVTDPELVAWVARHPEGSAVLASLHRR